MFENIAYIIISFVFFVLGYFVCELLNRRKNKNREIREQLSDSQSAQSDWWLLVIALFIFVGVLFIYFLNFRNGTISGDNQHWGQFADFVGGLTNPLLNVIVLYTLIKTLSLNSETLQEEKRRVKRQNAFDFSATFQSNEMMESRLKASKLLRATNADSFDLRKIRRSNEEEYKNLANVLNAFRQLNVLKQNNLIDENLSKELFGSYYCHFRKYLLLIVEADEKESDDKEKRSDKALLSQIKELDNWMPHDYSD